LRPPLTARMKQRNRDSCRNEERPARVIFALERNALSRNVASTHSADCRALRVQSTVRIGDKRELHDRQMDPASRSRERKGRPMNHVPKTFEFAPLCRRGPDRFCGRVRWRSSGGGKGGQTSKHSPEAQARTPAMQALDQPRGIRRRVRILARNGSSLQADGHIVGMSLRPGRSGNGAPGHDAGRQRR